MTSNYFECCSRVNPSDSVPEALSNVIIHNKKQDDEIAKKVNKDDLSEVANSGRYDDLIDKPIALPNPKPITINGQRYDGSEAVTVTVSSEGGGTPVEIDDTLTQSGKAADAKVVGDQLTALNAENAAQDEEIAKRAKDADLAAVAKSGSYNDLTGKPTALPNPKPIIINGQRYDGSEAVTVTVSSEGGGTPVEIDDTLTHSGKAADAKAVGDRLSALNVANAQQDEVIATKANDADLASVAKTGSYNDLTGKPTIPTVPEALKNPFPLTINGQSYDGSAAVEVTVEGGSAVDLKTLTAYEAGAVIPIKRNDVIFDQVIPMMNTRYFEQLTTIPIEPEQTDGVNNVIHESTIVSPIKRPNVAAVVYLENLTGNTTDTAIKGGDTRIRARYLTYNYGLQAASANVIQVGNPVDIMYPGVVMSDGTEALGGFGTCTAFNGADGYSIYVIAEGSKTSSEYGIYVSYADFTGCDTSNPPTNIVWSAPQQLMLTYGDSTVPYTSAAIAEACGLSSAIIQANNQVWVNGSTYYMAVNIRYQGVAVLTSSDGITWTYKGFYTTKYKCRFINESACGYRDNRLWIASRNAEASSTTTRDKHFRNYLTLMKIDLGNWTLIDEWNIPDCGCKPFFVAPFTAVSTTDRQDSHSLLLLHNPYTREAASILSVGNYPIRYIGEIRDGANYITGWGLNSAGKLLHMMTCGTNGLVTERKGALVRCGIGIRNRMSIDVPVMEWKRIPDPVKRNEIATDDNNWYTFAPNIVYVFSTAQRTELRWNIGQITDTAIQNVYKFCFNSGATPTVWNPNGTGKDVVFPDNFMVEANRTYEIEIFEGRASVKSWPYTPPATEGA